MGLEAASLGVSYGGPPTLSEVDLRLEEGSRLAIIGANGSGKTTLLKALCRILAPCGGTVCLDGRELSRWNTAELARRMAVLPQSHMVHEDLTVRDLVSLGRFPHRGTAGNSRKRDEEAVERALSLARMTELAERPLPRLSGGERQRAWLALTLAQEPRLLLLDEPTTYLDIRYQFEVLDLIRSLNEEIGITVAMVLHDLNHAARYSHRILALKRGRIVADGAPDAVLTPALLREVFGVEGVITREGGYPHFIATGRAF